MRASPFVRKWLRRERLRFRLVLEVLKLKNEGRAS